MDDTMVKFRLVHYYAEHTNPLTGEAGRTERLAFHGQTLHSGEGADTERDRYNVPESELKRLSLMGAFFHPAEHVAMGAGVTDDLTAPETFRDEFEPRGDTGSTGTIGSATGIPDGVHPLSFEEMSPWQVQEYLRTEPDVDLIVDAIAKQDGAQAQEALANKFLHAGHEIGWEADHPLALALAENAGIAPHGPGPDDEGGIKESVKKRGSSDGNTEDASTEAARKFAEENNVDIEDVVGSGSGGRVTQEDVRAYIAERDAS